MYVLKVYERKVSNPVKYANVATDLHLYLAISIKIFRAYVICLSNGGVFVFGTDGTQQTKHRSMFSCHRSMTLRCRYITVLAERL